MKQFKGITFMVTCHVCSPTPFCFVTQIKGFHVFFCVFQTNLNKGVSTYNTLPKWITNVKNYSVLAPATYSAGF